MTKDIIGYEGYYTISSTGIITRLSKTKKLNSGAIKHIPAKKLKITNNKGTYSTVVLIKNGVQKMHVMHRLLAIHFIHNDDPLRKREVNHKNKDKHDYRLQNLEWCTRKENLEHARQYKVRSSKKEKKANGTCLVRKIHITIRDWKTLSVMAAMGDAKNTRLFLSKKLSELAEEYRVTTSHPEVNPVTPLQPIIEITK